MSDTNTTSELALCRAFALLKCSPIKDPENSSKYGRAAYNLSEHCQGKEDVSEAAMRIFAERIESLEKQIKDMNNFSNAQYEELERVYKERDEAISARDVALKSAHIYDEAHTKALKGWAQAERERNELFEALSKIETVFVDGEDTYEDWRTMGNIAREALEVRNDNRNN
jgi:hypothetical protein